MRNLKKVLAVICVVAMLASTAIVPALAATSYDTQAATLNSLGLMTNAGLDQPSNRLQGLIFAIDAAGKQKEALAMSDADVAAALANVVDAKDIPAWGQKFAAYAVSKGYTTGVGTVALPAIKFAPLAPIHATEYLVWLLKIGMGYTNGTADILTTAVTNNIITIGQVTKFGQDTYTLVRDDIAGMLYTAVSTGKTAAGGKFIDALIANGAVTMDAAVAAGLVTAVPVTLGVSSVNALNLKQIQVVFSAAVVKADAEKVSNYKVAGNVLTSSDKVALQADGKSVLITLATAKTNNSKNDVFVSKNVTPVAGSAMAADSTTKDVLFVDTVIPTITGVTVTAPKEVTVTFSEPVQYTAGTEYATFVLDSGVVPVVSSDAAATTCGMTGKIKLSLGSSIAAGDHTLKIANSNVTDFAGYAVLANSSLAFAYVADTTAPTATVESVSEKVVKLRFNKSVGTDGSTLSTNVLFRHTYNSTSYQVTGSAAVLSEGGTLATITFVSPIAPGANTLYVSYDTGTGRIKDGFGNEYVPTTYPINVAMDNTAPTITNVTLASSTSIEVTYSEAVTGALTTTNYTLKNPAGDAVSISNVAKKANTDNTYVLTTATIKGGNYTLTIDGIKDTSVAANAMVKYTNVFAFDDKFAPSIGTVVAGVSSGKYNLFVSFSEAMNATDLSTLSNYRLFKGGQEVALDADNCTLTVVDPQTVKLATTFTTLATGTDKVIVNGAMKDLAGNAIGGFSASATIGNNTIGIKDYDSDTAGNQFAKVTAPDKFEVTIDKLIDTIDMTKVQLTLANVAGVTAALNTPSLTADYAAQAGTINNLTLVSLTKDLAAGTTKLVFALPSGKSLISDLSGLAVSANAIRFQTGALTSTLGNTNGGNLDIANTTVVDAAAPSVVSAITAPASAGDAKVGKVFVRFSEALDATSVSYDKFTVAGYKVTGMANAAGPVVTLNVTEDGVAGTGNKPVVTLIGNVRDAATAKNVLTATADTKVTADDGTLPVVTAATAQTVTGANNDKILITFSEAMDKTITLTNGDGFAVDDAQGNAINLTGATASWSEDGKVLTLTLANDDVITNDLLSVTYTAGTVAASEGAVAGLKALATYATAVEGFATGEVADATAPTVITAAADPILGAGGTDTIVFSEVLTAASKTAVETAITTANGGAAATLTYAWSNNVLTITNTGVVTPANDATFAGAVTCNISDGTNTTNGATLIP